MSQTIRGVIMLVKRVRIAASARNPGHAHGCGGIHSVQPFNDGVLSDERQQLICQCATIRAFYLMYPYFFIVVVHSDAPFLAENLLIQRLIIKLVIACQHNVKRIQWFICY